MYEDRTTLTLTWGQIYASIFMKTLIEYVEDGGKPKRINPELITIQNGEVKSDAGISSL